MNVVIMMGRLTKEPEIRYAANGTGMAIANYSLAVDRRFKREGQPTADFFDCRCFGKQAEFVEKYLHKGTKIVITGSLQNDNYQGRDGRMVYHNQIIVENHEFAESKSANPNAGAYVPQEPAAMQRSAQPAPQEAPSPVGNDFMNIPDGIDEELPFN